MAGSTQKKVVDEIKRIAAEAKVDADFEWSWGNIARVWFREGFKTHANAVLDFQTHYMTAALNLGSAKAEYFGKPDSIHRIDYGNASEFEELFASIRSALPISVPKRKGGAR